MKRILLSFGSLAIIVAPITTVISCGKIDYGHINLDITPEREMEVKKEFIQLLGQSIPKDQAKTFLGKPFASKTLKFKSDSTKEVDLNKQTEKETGIIGAKLAIGFNALKTLPDGTTKGSVVYVAQVKKIASLGVDMLAAGINNIHGKYPADWAGLRFDVLENIRDAIGGIPMVLHGGSGIPEDQVKRAISLGVAKVNINTELQLAFAAAVRKFIEEGKDKEGKNYDPRKLLKTGCEAMREVIISKLEMTGSLGKA